MKTKRWRTPLTVPVKIEIKSEEKFSSFIKSFSQDQDKENKENLLKVPQQETKRSLKKYGKKKRTKSEQNEIGIGLSKERRIKMRRKELNLLDLEEREFNEKLLKHETQTKQTFKMIDNFMKKLKVIKKQSKQKAFKRCTKHYKFPFNVSNNTAKIDEPEKSRSFKLKGSKEAFTAKFMLKPQLWSSLNYKSTIHGYFNGQIKRRISKSHKILPQVCFDDFSQTSPRHLRHLDKQIFKERKRTCFEFLKREVYD